MSRIQHPQRIAWLCPYPASAVNFNNGSRPESIIHPSPWITLQAPLVAATPGIELHVITVGKRYKEDLHVLDQGVHFHFLKVTNFPRGLLLFQGDRYRINRCLQKIRPSLVHAFGIEAGYGYSAVTSGYPAVVMIQGIISQIARASGGLRAILKNPRWLAPILLERYTVSRGQTFIVETQFAADYVLRINPAATIYPVKTPVRHDFFQVERHSGSVVRPVMLFVGNVIREKGIEILLRGVARVIKVSGDVTLHVVGPYLPGYMDSVLAPLLARLGIADRVRFHGLCSAQEIAELMSRVSLLVLPSYMDTAPNVVSEAQAAGVPVVATAVGGIPEMLESGLSGILVEPGSPEALAQGMLRLLREPVLAAKMAALAQARAVKERKPDVQVQKLLEIYRRTIEAAGGRPVAASDAGEYNVH